MCGRRGTGKRLVLLDRFITDNGGSRLDAGEINTRRYMLDCAHRGGRERDRPVSFVAVDPATIGDVR
ncbi:hypothetical protein [Streptomyces sp. NPDC093990]|uniref:hypothetical protein n=1 Tax=Streptomyces sp. NPDC093990 TaxID=3155306 RepID=UPI003418E9D2